MENAEQQESQGLPVGCGQRDKEVVVIPDRRGDDLLRPSTTPAGEGKDPPTAVRRIDGAAHERSLGAPSSNRFARFAER
jgi:hypothetical protein